MEDTKQGPVAMVGTPCHMVAATKIDHFSDILGETPIDIKIGLFCMENFSYSYMKKLLEENNIDLNDVKQCRIEKNYLWFYLTDGEYSKYLSTKPKHVHVKTVTSVWISHRNFQIFLLDQLARKKVGQQL